MRTAVAITLTALLLAGCGSSSHKKADAYAIAVNLTQQSFAQELTNASNKLKAGTTTGSDTRALDQAAKAVDRDVRKLKTIKPPDAALAAHRKLIRAMNDYAKAVRGVRTLVASGDPKDFQTARRRLGNASTAVENKFSEIVAEINDALA